MNTGNRSDIGRRLRIIVLAGAGLAGCEGGGGGGDVALDDFANELAKAKCEQFAHCCEAGEKFVPAGEDCVEFWTAVLEEEADVVDIRAAVEAGLTDYDPGQAGRCLDRVRSLSCAHFSAFIDGRQAAIGLECLNMLAGNEAEGEPCQEPYHCASGNCGGTTCVPPFAEGEACSSFCEDHYECSRCAGDLICEDVEGGGICVADAAIVPATICNGR